MAVSRRTFLAGAGAVAAGGLAACRPVVKPPPAPPPPPPPPPPPSPVADVLTLIFLYGGNDGFNTVIPYQDATYLARRGALALTAANGVLPVGSGFALHPALTGTKALWDQGDAAFVMGVGYPNADRSHFRSTDIWESGRPDAVVGSGWIGRGLDISGDPLHAVSVSSTLPRTLRGASRSGVAVSGGTLSIPGTNAFRTAFSQLATGDPADPLWATTRVRSQADLLRAQTALNPALSAPNPAGSALGALTTGIGRSLAAVARMIRTSGVPTRVYATSMGGFDTHEAQLPTHQTLLGQLDAAVGAFHRDLATSSGGHNVVTLVVSEFGRRLNANASAGTDHGTCAPVLALGAPVRGGFYGAPPSLTALDQQGDPIMTTDFRSVYATVLSRVLAADPAAILGSSAHTPLAFL